MKKKARQVASDSKTRSANMASARGGGGGATAAIGGGRRLEPWPSHSKHLTISLSLSLIHVLLAEGVHIDIHAPQRAVPKNLQLRRGAMS